MELKKGAEKGRSEKNFQFHKTRLKAEFALRKSENSIFIAHILGFIYGGSPHLATQLKTHLIQLQQDLGSAQTSGDRTATTAQSLNVVN